MAESSMSNNELFSALAAALRQERVLIVSVIEMLIEVERRRLYLQRACSSIYVFCTRHLGMSEGAAFRRTTVARMAQRFPMVLEALREGRVHLSNLAALRDVMTTENARALLAQIAGKTRREVEHIVVTIAPKADPREGIRKVPARATQANPPVVTSPPAGAGAATTTATATAAATPVPVPTPTLTSAATLVPTPTPTRTSTPTSPSTSTATPPLLPDTTPAPMAPPPAPATSRPIPPGMQVTALGEARHKVQFVASTALRKKLERAQSLMRHRHVSGDLAVVVERAMDLLLAKLEKERLGATSRPKPGADAKPEEKGRAKPKPKPKAKAKADADANANAKANAKAAASHAKTSVPAAVRREVVARDGEQCSFVSAEGERCAERDFLELDHRCPRAFGGPNDASNVRLLCRAHNQYAAELVFGRDHIERAIDLRRRRKKKVPRGGAQGGGAQTPLPI